MKDITCSCGTKMEFQCYIPTAGENVYNVMRGIYKCPNCKNTEYIKTEYSEFKDDVYTKEYLEQEKHYWKRVDRNQQFIIVFPIFIIILLIIYFYLKSINIL